VVLRPTPDMGLIISFSTKGATGVAGAEEEPPPFFPWGSFEESSTKVSILVLVAFTKVLTF